MNILSLMQSAFYLIMNALLYPVIIALIFLVGAVLFVLGNFVSECVFRRKYRSDKTDSDLEIEQLAAQVANDILISKIESASDHVKTYIDKSVNKTSFLMDFMKDFALQIVKGKENLDIRAEKTLHHYEIMISSLLDKTRMMIRIGPMLGLMGTLIPMGPALLALTKGDLTQMANCLIIAFGTTVSGLAVGVVSYIISVIRERWYEQDIKDMEYMIDLVIGHIENSAQLSDQENKQNITVIPMARG